MPMGPSQSYLARYNGYVLPGYVQEETMDSLMNIEEHYAPYADGSLSEYTGLQNKLLTLRLKVWECDYPTAVNEVRKAATILRSKKGWARLHLQDTDKYFNVLTRRIGREKIAGTSTRILEYGVEFEAEPWLIGASGHVLTGTGTIDTDQVGRTIDNGGWTPTTITVTGTNVTISGYTATGDFAGFVHISGAVTNLVLDSGAFTATIGGVNANDRLYSVDYRTYVGPAKTFFTSTGASSVSIAYQDRWYL